VNITIRKADSSDSLIILEGTKDFARRTNIKHFADNDDELFDCVNRIIALDGMEVSLAEYNGKIVGGIGILYFPYLWNHSLTIGQEIFWWTLENAPFRTARYLFDTAIKEINDKGAIPMFHALDPVPKSVEKLYHENGLSLAEMAFVKWQ